MSTALILLTFLAAMLEWAAIFKGWRRLEFFAKPAVMVFLLAWVLTEGEAGTVVIWYSLGLVFSLVGDLFLLLSNERRWFLFGLAAFFLAHLTYLIGLNSPPPPFNALTIGVAAMVIFSVLPMMRRILLGLQQKGLRRLVEPVRAYGIVISLVLFSALMTLFRNDWQSIPAYLTSLGVLLFVSSDVLLAWNKFVKPVRSGRLILMILYHLGQILLIVGVMRQAMR